MTGAEEPDSEETLAELTRLAADPKTFERLLDSLPGAIETGNADRIIVGLKAALACHGLYPVERALQHANSLARSGRLHNSGGTVDSA